MPMLSGAWRCRASITPVSVTTSNLSQLTAPVTDQQTPACVNGWYRIAFGAERNPFLVAHRVPPALSGRREDFVHRALASGVIGWTHVNTDLIVTGDRLKRHLESVAVPAWTSGQSTTGAPSRPKSSARCG